MLVVICQGRVFTIIYSVGFSKHLPRKASYSLNAFTLSRLPLHGRPLHPGLRDSTSH